jgi:hypothetical protein
MLRWVRANRARCGLLALFALALQLYLSFGHIHAEDLGLAPPAGVIAQAGAAGHDGGSGPADHDDHDVCAICVTLGLTASSVVPVAAPLAVPVASEFAWPQDFISPRLEARFAASFHARAPPHA